jgi:hypothetical protein
LLSKAKKLESIAYSTAERNRVIGSPGHNATINYIKDTIASFPSYYSYSLQPFDLSLGVSANLTLDAADVEAFAVGLSPAGSVKAKVVHVANLGCEAVSEGLLFDIISSGSLTQSSRTFLPRSQALSFLFSVEHVCLL